ncbi:hypothetical protein SARC_11214 [Sphaeroforma arctica JP610]|uniref:S1 motif domain-containing protein n=1 Tax=Sphaeroforma arctica JP610 TaxID=667725 RepID=A0A0L0FIG8_9EUKA|nr:hypothetical protein SARC_11214 [Sphaeroforma arctica JP610]KNC76276.1 hypothetical protein SARC_11214 [Sphaeroforma arctica JP610]|eukprot:XP_014150178.1 hypothetical protein SARC_11214 [Sphaeroforma arctica JP610]
MASEDNMETDTQQQSSETRVIPGEPLGTVYEYAIGEGTFVRGHTIHASHIGVRDICESTQEGKLPIISVISLDASEKVIPVTQSVVVVRITSVNPRFAKCDIVCVGSTPLKDTYRGLIRQRDVRATQKDTVDIYKSFRPGDIVRAQVISLGDAKSYYLSTASNEYGVVFATSPAGHTMLPVSWCEMICPETHVREMRKVAKPLDIETMTS